MSDNNGGGGSEFEGGLIAEDVEQGGSAMSISGPYPCRNPPRWGDEVMRFDDADGDPIAFKRTGIVVVVVV